MGKRRTAVLFRWLKRRLPRWKGKAEHRERTDESLCIIDATTFGRIAERQIKSRRRQSP